MNLGDLFKQWYSDLDRSKRPKSIIVTMDIPLTRSPFGVEPLAFADLLVWLCFRYPYSTEEVPRYLGYDKMLNSSDFGRQGEIVGKEIGVFCLEL